MPARVIAGSVAFAVLIAAAALWTYRTPPQPAREPRKAVQVAAPGLSAQPTKGREMLSRSQIHQALANGTLDRPVQSLLTVNKPLQFGDYVWNDASIPTGPVWIRVDLGSQLISVFRAGHEIGTSVIVYGGDNKQTPGGKFHILARDKDHRSSIYDAEMPYTLQLTDDGVSIHGSNVRWGAATHGCIGVPLEFAERLFDQARVGDEVTILGTSRKAPQTTS